MNLVRQPVPLMTAEEFLVWEPGDCRHWQLVDGQPTLTPPANRSHGAIHAEAGRLLANHLLERGDPRSVLVMPATQPRVQAQTNIRIPDLAVVSGTYGVEDEIIVRTPKLIVEVLAAEDRELTWSNVWTYVTIPSVQEIVVISSMAVEADQLCRAPDGSWPDQPTKITDGADITFASIGLTLKLRALYRTTRLA
jgi:Uma2 family endonuclease